jgi:hypothetical protein
MLLENIIPVKRWGFIKFVGEYLIKVLVIVAGLIYPTVAQIIQHGTCFLARFSKDYVVVAIDSREWAGARVDDRYCKRSPSLT